MTNSSPLAILLCLIAVFALTIPFEVHSQTVGSDDYEAPTDSLPGEANTAPPTAPATPGEQPGVHSGDQAPAAQQQQDRQLPEGSRTVTVRVAHATEEHPELKDIPVVLEAVRPPGPLQPDNFRQSAQSWLAVTDADGIAVFENLPDTFSQRGLRLQATTGFGGLTFSSDYAVAADDLEIDLNIYDRTYTMPNLRITKKRVLISAWEEHLVFDQFWTLEIDGDYAIDVGSATDPALERGIMLRLPIQAGGISFSGPGDHTIINNNVFWSSVLQPDRPVTIQIRFSKSARSTSYTFAQEMDYPVDEIQLLAPLATSFERIPRLDDLALLAPGFDVGTDPGAADLYTEGSYLVATGNSVDAGESYTFRVEGLPFSRPIGGWIALFSGLLAALFIGLYGRREYKHFHDSRGRSQILKALTQRRDLLYDELAEIEDQLENDTFEFEDEAFELEEEQTLIRQRLALILRKIESIEADGEPTFEAA